MKMLTMTRLVIVSLRIIVEIIDDLKRSWIKVTAL